MALDIPAILLDSLAGTAQIMVVLIPAIGVVLLGCHLNDRRKWTLRGHPITKRWGHYVYRDTMTPTAGAVRPCGNCGINADDKGNDACLGTLPNVMNACCGHGVVSSAYVQFWDGTIIDGIAAVNVQKTLSALTKELV